ncbi:hypothetical protein AB1K84_19175 [Mesobacillus foraminis]|uniref:Uncharacterized protein n=1 Tax=Mesobacillus foraminis TaxID=279826 RepID=A0A4R2B7F6_9BACI|nr:hypothetical protein [Mesobacillus foraminis]MBT2758129.1 hypothetical protein [Mesobacillus foraminis]TCN22273.1 hypothetical protein EV146_111111 [Mesobacillus foraminis]
MYRKNCERCGRPSFSSSEAGTWHCPVCGNDLTNYPFFDAETLEKLIILQKWRTQVYDKNHRVLK